MKYKLTQIFIFLIFIYIFQCETKEEMFNLVEETAIDTDSDDLILKMKTFFDNYANKINEGVNTVDKLIIPSEKTKFKVEYLRNYNPEDLKRQTINFIDELNMIRQNDLNIQKETKEKVEEKNIDLITNNKILNSRMNIGEKTKSMNDLNEKNNSKISLENEILANKEKSEKLITNELNKIKSVRSDMKDYDSKIINLELNEKIFEDEIKIQNNLEKLRANIYKIDFESEFLKNQNLTKVEFSNKAKILNETFVEGFIKLHKRIEKTKEKIQNKTENLKKIKKEISSKYEIYENLNNTINKLKIMQNDYVKALKDLEENINFLKSKKHIILDNISEKNTQKNIRKKTIETVLNNLEKQLDQYNVDKINVNKYRKDITNINNRITSLLGKENMIFKTNKIKI